MRFGPSATESDARRVVSLAVNNKGVVGVMIVERRMNARERCLETTFSASFDGGTTFTAPTTVSTSSCGDTPIDTIATRLFPTYGDYFGIATTPDGGFHLMWPEMRDSASVLMTALVNADK